MRKVEEFSATSRGKRDYDTMFDGGIYRLEQGEDFPSADNEEDRKKKVTTTANGIRAYAAKHRLKVQVRQSTTQGFIEVQYLGKDHSEPKPKREKKAVTTKVAATA